jgi:hypothetical protein
MLATSDIFDLYTSDARSVVIQTDGTLVGGRYVDDNSSMLGDEGGSRRTELHVRPNFRGRCPYIDIGFWHFRDVWFVEVVEVELNMEWRHIQQFFEAL